MNEKNLRKDFTRAERQENGRKGAAVTNAKKIKRKQLKEILDVFLKMEAPQKMKDKALEILPDLENERLSLKDTLVVCLIEKIMAGDTKAFEIMRDTIGEKPVEKIGTFEIKPPVINDDIG